MSEIETVVEELLYHTHDKWGSTKGRDKFKETLLDFHKRDSRVLQTLKHIKKLASEPDTICMTVSVFKIINEKHCIMMQDWFKEQRAKAALYKMEVKRL